MGIKVLKTTKYSFLSTFELIEKISRQDKSALNYFISNRKLLPFNNKRITLPEFLYKLRKDNFSPFILLFPNEKHLVIKLDMTYNRTLTKFTELKPDDVKKGLFCNKQYESLLEQIKDFKKKSPNYTELELEKGIEIIFKRMVVRHLRYEWKEVCRSNTRLYKRYPWKLPTGTIELKRPQHIDGRSFNKWLAEHVDNPNPEDKKEKYRIQKIIGDWFGSLSEIDISDIDYTLKESKDPYAEIEKYPEDFKTMLATEKSSNIESLRSAIRVLGKAKLYSLVKEILESHEFDESKDSEIQRKYGLSKSTFSRFAGRNWNINNREVPDLWKNIAAIVLKDPILEEHAISYSISKTIMDLLDKKEC